MHIHESAEDYLEAILRLRETKGQVRSVDISKRLGGNAALRLVCDEEGAGK